MLRLLKIYDQDCPICSALEPYDKDLAEEKGLLFVRMGLPALVYMNGKPLYEHVVDNYVEDGLIDVPVYLILSDSNVEASGLVKSIEELRNLLEAWETYSTAQ